MGGLIINEGRIAADDHDGHSDRDSLGQSPDKTTKGIMNQLKQSITRISSNNQVRYPYIFRPQLSRSSKITQASLFETLYYYRYLVHLQSEEEALKSLR